MVSCLVVAQSHSGMFLLFPHSSLLSTLKCEQISLPLKSADTAAVQYKLLFSREVQYWQLKANVRLSYSCLGLRHDEHWVGVLDIDSETKQKSNDLDLCS